LQVDFRLQELIKMVEVVGICFIHNECDVMFTRYLLTFATHGIQESKNPTYLHQLSPKRANIAPGSYL
jgi:hypothetical protein